VAFKDEETFWKFKYKILFKKMDKNVLYNVVASLLNAAYGHETKVTHS